MPQEDVLAHAPAQICMKSSPSDYVAVYGEQMAARKGRLHVHMMNVSAVVCR